MAKLTRCRLVCDGQAYDVRATLDEEGFHVRGGMTLDADLTSIDLVRVDGPNLHIGCGGTEVVLALTDRTAANWMKFIQQPPSPAQKLGLRPGMSVAVLGMPTDSFYEPYGVDDCLRSSTTYDVIVIGVHRTLGLREVRTIAGSLAEKGSLWVVYPRASRDIPMSAVLAHGRMAFLRSIKVVRYSTTETAIKFVRNNRQRIQKRS